MRVGLFFGSFNPIHTGHLIIAHHFTECSDLDEVWFVVSPQNPLKTEDSLIDASLRLKMVQVSVSGNKKFKVCDAEFTLPKPSYTINTLHHINAKHPWHDFVLLMGADSFSGIKKWKDYKTILNSYPLYLYQRETHPIKNTAEWENVSVFNFPLLNISSTYIRQLMDAGKSVRYLVPDKALKHLQAY